MIFLHLRSKPMLSCLLLASLSTSLSCDLPRDPEGTLKAIRGGTMRVGVSEARPWVVRGDTDEPAGIEVELVQRLAQELNAEIQWYWGTTEELLERVERRQLDLLICGLTSDTPWKRRVGLTRPYFTERPHPDVNKPKRHVMAVPPGENGWIVRLERFLHEAVPSMTPSLSDRVEREADGSPLEPVQESPGIGDEAAAWPVGKRPAPDVGAGRQGASGVTSLLIRNVFRFEDRPDPLACTSS